MAPIDFHRVSLLPNHYPKARKTFVPNTQIVLHKYSVAFYLPEQVSCPPRVNI